MRRVTRVAISADDSNGLDSVVSPHFGRCPYYVLVDLDGREASQVNAVRNPAYGQHRPGQVPGFIKSQGADVMLAGGMGRRAIGFFQQYGIRAARAPAPRWSSGRRRFSWSCSRRLSERIQKEGRREAEEAI